MRLHHRNSGGGGGGVGRGGAEGQKCFTIFIRPPFPLGMLKYDLGNETMGCITDTRLVLCMGLKRGWYIHLVIYLCRWKNLPAIKMFKFIPII